MFVRRLIGLGAALAVFAACADTPTQVDLLDSSLIGTADRTVKMVPFHSTNTNAPTDASGVVCLESEASLRNLITGNATHLGKFTGEVSGCVGRVTGTYSSISNTFVAANGDELWTDMDPSNPGQIIVFQPFLGGSIVTVGGLNIVGGTGRFEGASGNLTFRTDAIFGVVGSAVTAMTGQISSPGSIKWATP